jgi:hypothetical protein
MDGMELTSRKFVQSARIVTPLVVSKCIVTVDEIIANLLQRKRSLRRSELEDALRSLGFSVRAGSSGGHRVFTHPKLSAFYGSRFNGGHGQDAEILPVYVGQVIKVLRMYKSELEFIQEHPNG